MGDQLVSAVIPCFNTARYVGAAITSALEQTYQPIEIVVVDDGSTDDFDGAIAQFAGRIQLVRQSNTGLAHARNAGIEASDSEFIAFLDADDRWHPDKIERQVDFLNRR